MTPKQQLLARKLAETSAFQDTQQVFLLAKDWRTLGVDVPAEVGDLRPWPGTVGQIRSLAEPEVKQLAIELSNDD